MKKALLLPALALLLAAAAAEAEAAAFPSRAVISMKGYWGFMPVGTAVQTWSLQDGRYRLENRLSGLGFRIRYLSEGQVDGEQLRPQYYAEFRGREELPRYESRFDWARKTVSYGKPADPRQVALQTPVQDLNALPFDLAWRHGAVLSYNQLSNGRKLKQASFVREADQMVEVGGQKVRTVYLVSRLPGKETVELWLAPSLSYLPVRVRYDGSEKIEMQAFKVEVDGRVLAGS